VRCLCTPHRRTLFGEARRGVQPRLFCIRCQGVRGTRFENVIFFHARATASGDSLCPNIQHAFMSPARTTGCGKNMAAENLTCSINDVVCHPCFELCKRVSCHLFPMPLCTPSLMNYDCGWGWVTHRNVDQMQDKTHAQAQGQHTKSSTGHLRIKGPRNHNTNTRRHAAGPRQTGLLTRKQVQGTRMQVHSTRTQGYAVQAPGQGYRTCLRPLS